MTASEPRRRQSPTGEWQYQGADGYWYDDHHTASAARSPSESYVRAPLWSESSERSLPAAAWMTILGSAGAGIGTFLPWITFHAGFNSVNRNAFQLGNQFSLTWVGPVILIMAVVSAAIGIARLTNTSMPNGLQSSPIVAGIALLAVVGFNYPTYSTAAQSSLSELGIAYAVGYGYWVCIVGGGLITLSGFALRYRSPTPNSGSFIRSWIADKF